MHRQVVETAEFTDQLASLGSVQFLDERLAAVQWVATLDAEDLPAVSESGRLRVIRILGYGGVPTLRVFIEISDSEALFRWIEVVPDAGA